MKKFISYQDFIINFGLIFLPFSLLIIKNKDLISIDSLLSSLLFPTIIFGIFSLFQIILFFFKFNILRLINFLIILNIFLNILNENSYLKIEIFLFLNILFLILFYIFRKKIFQNFKLNNILITTLFLLFGFSLTQFTFYKLNNEKTNYTDIFYEDNFKNIKIDQIPNILHIIPDGLINVNYLNNNELRSLIFTTFKKLEIDIFEKSITNYPTTFLSLSSSLNGSLINEKIIFKENNFNKYIHNSKFHEFLKKNNYDIFWYRTRWIGSKCNNKLYKCMNQTFYNNEIVKNYLQLINFNFFWLEKIIFKINNKIPLKHLDIVHSDLEEILKKQNYPKYIFAYLNIPHSPFSVNENCYPISLTKIDQSIFTESEYNKQTKCLIKQIKKLVSNSVFQKQNFLIIIQSDTGWVFNDIPSKENPNIDWPDKKFKNFIAVSSKFNCLDKKKIISNADLLPNLMGCLGNDNINLKNNQTFNAYYSDHPRTGKIYRKNIINF